MAPNKAPIHAGGSMTPTKAPAYLYRRIRDIWEAARTQAARSVNTAHVCANWLIGEQIVRAEQGGARRAGYGAGLLKALSAKLASEYGTGFSVSALQYMRGFFLAYPDLMANQHALRVNLALKLPLRSKQHAPRVESASAIGWRPGVLHEGLSWTHYRLLIKEEREPVRNFYEMESIRSGWSARQLERQMGSLLFERLAKSRDKKGVLALSQHGQVVAEPQDVIKDPYVLEFLDLPQSHRLVESQVEEALIGQIQSFLLELGNGFAFVGRQVRLTLDGDHFYPDLVFYHTKLKCYAIIDIKVGKLTHADLGQMLLYVNYYDREIANTDDNPSIGLILCSEKNDAVVRYVLADKNSQVYASRYQLHLPTEEQLRTEIRREYQQLGLPPEQERRGATASSVTSRKSAAGGRRSPARRAAKRRE